MSYVLGEESRDEFLSRQVGSYPAVAFINRALPNDAVVYLFYLSGRGYYLDREYLHHVGLETAIVKAMARSAADTETLTAFLRSTRVHPSAREGGIVDESSRGQLPRGNRTGHSGKTCAKPD